MGTNDASWHASRVVMIPWFIVSELIMHHEYSWRTMETHGVSCVYVVKQHEDAWNPPTSPSVERVITHLQSCFQQVWQTHASQQINWCSLLVYNTKLAFGFVYFACMQHRTRFWIALFCLYVCNTAHVLCCIRTKNTNPNIAAVLHTNKIHQFKCWCVVAYKEITPIN